MGGFSSKPASVPNIKQMPNGVKFYENANYDKLKASLGPGKYNMNDLASLGLRNDSLSSIKVPLGMATKLYWDANFSGKTRDVNDDISFLDGGWNDQTSSVEVKKVDRKLPVSPQENNTIFRNCMGQIGIKDRDRVNKLRRCYNVNTKRTPSWSVQNNYRYVTNNVRQGDYNSINDSKRSCERKDQCKGFFVSKGKTYYLDGDLRLDGREQKRPCTPLTVESKKDTLNDYYHIPNSDFPGSDIRSVRNSSAKDCAKECGKDKNCRGFMFNTSNKNCWLKSRLRNQGRYGRVSTGIGQSYIKKQPYKCYHWSNQDEAEFRRRGYGDKIQLEVCEREPNRIFTKGDNKYYQGAGGCWCIQDGDRTKKEKTCGKLYKKRVDSTCNINLKSNQDGRLAQLLPNDIKNKNTTMNEYLDIQDCEQYRLRDPFMYVLCRWLNDYFKSIFGNNGEINNWDNLTLTSQFAKDNKNLADLQKIVNMIFDQKKQYEKWAENEKRKKGWMREGFENQSDDSKVTKLVIVIAIVLILYFALMFLKK